MHIDATGAWILLAICTFFVILILSAEYLSPAKKETSLFQSMIWAAAIWGGALAFLLPIALDLGFGPNDDGRVLRQLLLYTTGGVLGVITLSETRRKNDLERSKFEKQNDQFTEQLNAQKENLKTELEAQKENLNSQLEAQKKNLNSQLEAQKKNLNSQLKAQKETLNSQLQSQKDNLESQLKAQHDNLELQLTSQEKKDKRDHTRQVHAERRSRYTKAVEQLANENAAVRLGGVYTLVGLVDEWLADSNIKEKEDRRKEGQVIINNLCSYIRSPFPLAAKIEEYEAHQELEDLQKTESEMLSEEESSRLQVLLKRFEDSGEYEKPEDITADYAKFHEEQDVRRTIFVEMSKRSSTFTMNEQEEIIETISGMWSDFDFDFSRAPVFYPLNAITIEKGNFSSAKFYSNADFSEATFTQNADFSKATFTQKADFSGAKFTQKADFSGAKFTQNADFSEATFTQTADFYEAAFTQNADFSWATFTQTARFIGATFTQTADFSWATFTQTANFSGATFTQTADFIRATFTQTANFSAATFSASSPKFVEISKVLDWTFRARFAALAKNQEAHNFMVSEDSFRIPPGEATLLGETFEIPLGTVLFDPMSPKNKDGNYSGLSEPAK